MKPAIQRPAHLVPAAAASAIATAPIDPVPSTQDPTGVSRHTRAQRSARSANGSNMSPATAHPPIDMERKYSPLPQSSTLSPIDPDAETASGDDSGGEDGDDDSSPPDEGLEEGEVPSEIVQQLLATAQHM